MPLHGSYNDVLVTLSVAMAVVAAYAALGFTDRITAIRTRTRILWLAGGATSMGLGIWAMHYIGMLAFNLPVPVLYHYPTVILSLLVAIVASFVAMSMIARQRSELASCLAGSLVLGGGIAAMHYLGMQAMRLPAMMEYRWPFVLLSILLGIAASFLALTLAFRMCQEKARFNKPISALIMGLAIPLMHYCGMFAVRFRSCNIPFNTRFTVQVSSLGTVVISVASLLLLILAILIAYLDRTLTTQAEAARAARDGEARFRLLAEAIPEIVWTALPGTAIDYCNQRWSDLTGLTLEQSMGWGWRNALHLDDLPVAMETWAKARKAGVAVDMEYRIRTVSGSYRWHLVRATPMRDSEGNIVKWFGSCVDIDDQMRHQEVLEEQIKKHTQALMDANTRLETEMRERALAQQELNQQNERVLRELTQRSNRATTLAKMAELLQSCADLPDIFSVVSGMAPRIFPELRGAVLLFNASRDLLEVTASWSGCRLPAPVFGPQDCWALRTGHLHMVAAGDSTAVCKHVAPGQSSFFCLPLLSQGEPVGVLHFQLIEEPQLPETAMLIVHMFAEQVGLSVSNLRLREALRNQSIRDPLTGLFNRRYLEETLEREVRRAVRSGQSLGLLMLDLDHFKKFNDSYGHEAGDTVLRETASFLARSVRAEDVVCRFGGEEFVVILPVADLKATRTRAERICTRLRELHVVHQGQSVGSITVSVGVAALPDHGAAPKTLLEAADAALYRAKREGRDRVVVAETFLGSEEQLGSAQVSGS